MRGARTKTADGEKLSSPELNIVVHADENAMAFWWNSGHVLGYRDVRRTLKK